MDDKFSTTLGKAIESKGLNPTTFAEKVGVSPNSVLKWVKEESFPKSDKWQLIKQYSGIDPQKYVDYSTGEKGVIVSIQTTTGNRSPAQQHTGAGNMAMFDKDGITCTGLDERHAPAGVNVDEWAELLYWLRRHPTMMRRVLEEARKKGLDMDEAANG